MFSLNASLRRLFDEEVLIALRAFQISASLTGVVITVTLDLLSRLLVLRGL